MILFQHWQSSLESGIGIRVTCRWIFSVKCNENDAIYMRRLETKIIFILCTAGYAANTHTTVHLVENRDIIIHSSRKRCYYIVRGCEWNATRPIEVNSFLQNIQWNLLILIFAHIFKSNCRTNKIIIWIYLAMCAAYNLVENSNNSFHIVRSFIRSFILLIELKPEGNVYNRFILFNKHNLSFSY